MQRFTLPVALVVGLAALALLGLLGTQPTARSQAVAPPAPGKPNAPNYCENYQLSISSGTQIVSGTVNIGNNCDDCETQLALPFAYQVYSQTFSSVLVSSNGRLDFVETHDPGSPGYTNTCLPAAPDINGHPFDYTIFAHWDDLTTSAGLTGCAGYATGCGVFTSVSGSAPNRVFNIEWRAVNYLDNNLVENFEVQLSEGQPAFHVIYGTLGEDGSGTTVGIQGDQVLYTQYTCNSCGLYAGLDLGFALLPCGQITPVPQATCYVSPTPTRSPTRTPSPSPTGSPTPPPAAGPVVGGPGIQDQPDVSSGYIVWEDNGSGTWDIKAKNQATNTVFTVAGGAGDQRLPAISDNLVVWQTNSAGTWDVYGAYLTGNGAGQPFAVATGPGDQTNPAVSGNWVAFQTSDGTSWDIQVKDVVGGQLITMSDSGLLNSEPAIDGPNVVWQSTVPTTTKSLKRPAGGTSGWNIIGATIGGQGASAITGGSNDHVNPAVSNNFVVWQEFVTDAHGSHWIIKGQDLTSQQVYTVTDAPGDQTEPSIDGDQVLYVASEPSGPGAAPLACGSGGGGGTRRAVRGTGSRSGGVDDSPISAYGCSASNPRSRGSRRVWDQDPPGVSAQADIYGNVCTIGFSDVHTNDYFYSPVQALTCAGAISGYADNTFRPYADTTRGQLAKIIVLGEAWAIDTAGGPHFSDVPSSNPFYPFIETAYNRGIISGYADGTFRWGANVTRGQLSKIIVQAQGWALDTSGGPHFSDVPPANPFYAYVETAFHRNIISGYADGTFRVGANATRGQIAKIVWGALQQP